MSVRAAASQVSPADAHVRRWALISGVGLILMAALAVFANFVVLEGLVTPDDVQATARDVSKSSGLFGWGIAAWCAIAALDLLAAWGLYLVLRPAHHRLAAFSGVARFVYGLVLLVAVTRLVQGLQLLTGVPGPADQAQGAESIQSFTDIWNLGLIFFGIHLLLAGYVAYRSGYIPRFVAVATGIAGFGYLFDAAMRATVDDPSFVLSAITGMGEFVLAVWLVSRGRRISVPATLPTRDGLTATSAAEVTA